MWLAHSQIDILLWKTTDPQCQSTLNCVCLARPASGVWKSSSLVSCIKKIVSFLDKLNKKTFLSPLADSFLHSTANSCLNFCLLILCLTTKRMGNFFAYSPLLQLGVSLKPEKKDLLIKSGGIHFHTYFLYQHLSHFPCFQPSFKYIKKQEIRHFAYTQ